VAGVVFVMCALTCVFCLALLVRAYRTSRGRLVLWTAICFTGLALNNILLAINELLIPHTHIAWRGIPAAAGLLALMYGLGAEEVRSRRPKSGRVIARRHSRASA
jgi:hypothetical protein